MLFSINKDPLPNIDKVGNLIIFFADKVPNLYLTKLLKLLYIIDEISMSETGVPVTWLEYRVWKKGPVAIDIYKDLTFENSEMLEGFAEGIKDHIGTKVKSTNKFDDGEFSDYELELLERVVVDYGRKSTDDLIDFLHKENSLWHLEVEKEGLVFDNGGTSTITIDLNQINKDNPTRTDLFQNVKESLDL